VRPNESKSIGGGFTFSFVRLADIRHLIHALRSVAMVQQKDRAT
jgi:hypothetical protein